MGMKMARVASAWMEPSKRPMTEAARMAVPRLISRQTSRLGNTAAGGSSTVSSPAAPPSRWMSSVASSRMTSMTSSTLMMPSRRWSRSTTGTRHEVVLAHQPRDLLLVGVGGHASPTSSWRRSRIGVAGRR